MRIDSAGHHALYRQIADQLRSDIQCGEREPGTQLPSESQLMAKYEVSRVTARRALGVLATEGLAAAEHGRGWFVRSKPLAEVTRVEIISELGRLVVLPAVRDVRIDVQDEGRTLKVFLEQVW